VTRENLYPENDRIGSSGCLRAIRHGSRYSAWPTRLLAK
jgi:hypothetical protein